MIAPTDGRHPEPQADRPRAGVSLRHHAGLPVADILAQAITADRQGFHSVWLSDHILEPFTDDHRAEGPFDAFTLATAIAAVTSNVRIGWTMLNATLRPPALLAKMLATVDHISNGRLMATLGTGYAEREYDAYGLPFDPDPAERSAHLREVVEMLKEVWTHPAPHTVTYVGRFVKTDALPFNPVPVQQPHPPIWIGGDSDRTLSMVKDLADGWVMGVGAATPGRLEAARAAPDWPSRPMAVAKVAHAAVVRDEDELAAETAAVHAALTPVFGPSLGTVEDFAATAIVGTPAECRRRLEADLARGLDTHIFYFPDDERQARFAELLLPL